MIDNDDLDRAYKQFKRVALGEKIPYSGLPPLDD
jgi:ribosomal protein S21